MSKLNRKILSLAASFAAAALLAAGGLAAQGGEPEQPPSERKRQQVRALPQVTGTVVLWNGDRIDLKTWEGKTQKVAVNADTERLVEIQEGAEVMVEYRRKVGSFIIAERVRPVEESAAEPAQPGTGTASVQGLNTVTGEVVSWNDAALALRTDAGDVTLFLSPETEYLVKSLDPGLLVTVEYREGSDRAKLATRVRSAQEESGAKAAKKKGGPD
jgi:hypothetical protein